MGSSGPCLLHDGCRDRGCAGVPANLGLCAEANTAAPCAHQTSSHLPHTGQGAPYRMLCVCVCVCVRACVHVCMYLCVHTCVRACVRTCVYVPMCAYVCACMCACMCACAVLHTCTLYSVIDIHFSCFCCHDNYTPLFHPVVCLSCACSTPWPGAHTYMHVATHLQL